MQESRWVKLGLLTCLSLVLFGCGIQNTDPIRQDRLGTTDSFALVKWEAVNSTYVLNQWSASGGFFGIIGGVSAHGGDQIYKDRGVVVALLVPKDNTIIVLELPIEDMRLKYGQPASIQFLYWTHKANTERYNRLREMKVKNLIVADLKEVIITLPQDQLDDYLAIVVK